MRTCLSTLLLLLVSLAGYCGEPIRLDITVPMRDGTELPTTILLPAKEGATQGNSNQENSIKYPCVLVRQPLGKKYASPSWLQLATKGYMVAIQSTRSSCDASGETLPYLTDGYGALQDGYDTVEWLAASPWCNGKVATIGSSATGITQLLLAPAQPPHLVCQYIEVAPPSLYDYAIWPGGQFRKEPVEGWLQTHKFAPSVLQLLKSQPTYDAFWRQFDARKVAARVQASQVHVGGWYDVFVQGTIDAFQTVREASNAKVRGNHKLIIGPWGHRWRNSTTFGDFAPIALAKSPPIQIEEWLDFHMKATNNHVQEAPDIQYYVMGPLDGTPSEGNKWRSAHKWPPDSILCQMYLSQNRELTSASNEKELGTVDVIFDAANPVPTIGGRNLFLPDGPKNLAALEKRPDVVFFTSKPLSHDTEVTGRIMARLYVSNVFTQRDVCCRLADVYPDGKSIIIAEGVTHIHPQENTSSENTVSASDPQPVSVDLWSTSMVFAKGHRIQLLVSGSLFPSYDTSLAPNPDEAKEHNICFTIHNGGKYASALSLPTPTQDHPDTHPAT